MQHINPVYHHSPRMLQQEQQWIHLAKEDPKYFAPLYKKYHDQIFRYVYHRIMDKHIACDVTSQVFLKALKNLDKFKFQGVPLSAWLYRIAKSELNQTFRDKKAKNTVNIDNAHLTTFMHVFEEESNTLNKERLKRAMQKLDSEDLALIKKRYFESCRYKEMGDFFAITENNAKVKTFRALNRLKIFFEAA